MQFLRLSLYAVLVAVAHHPSPSDASADAAPEGGAAVAPMPKDQKEFLEKSAKLTTLTNKISDSEKQFNELVHHKNAAKDTAEKQRLIHEMVELANQRNKDVDAYNKLKSDLELRYPNEGEHLNRRYHTQTKRSMEELEGVAGLDELLTRTKKVVEKKFAPFMKDEPKAPPKKKLAHEPDAGEEPKRLRLEK